MGIHGGVPPIILAFCHSDRIISGELFVFAYARPGRTQCAQAGESARYLSLGTVALKDYDRFCGLADKFLRKAEARKGDKRSAAANDQGNQKTPALIQALLRDALDKLDNEEEPDESKAPPRGGFTDVGLHTGGSPRNTGWPLVQAVMQALFEEHDGGHVLYRQAVANLKLWLAERQLSVLRPETADAKRVDICVQMMAAAAAAGSELADDGLDMISFEARCIVIRFVSPAFPLPGVFCQLRVNPSHSCRHPCPAADLSSTALLTSEQWHTQKSSFCPRHTSLMFSAATRD